MDQVLPLLEFLNSDTFVLDAAERRTRFTALVAGVKNQVAELSSSSSAFVVAVLTNTSAKLSSWNQWNAEKCSMLQKNSPQVSIRKLDPVAYLCVQAKRQPADVSQARWEGHGLRREFGLQIFFFLIYRASLKENKVESIVVWSGGQLPSNCSNSNCELQAAQIPSTGYFQRQQFCNYQKKRPLQSVIGNISQPWSQKSQC